MNNSWKSGIGFGVTSAVITTLWLMIGLITSTESRLAVIGGIITIAIADAMSDAMGMHISQEYSKHSEKNIWSTTLMTFVTKLFVAITFILAVVLLPLDVAAIVNVFWGLLLICCFSYIIAKTNKEQIIKVVFEHLIIVIIVIIITYFIGLGIKSIFV